MKSARNLSSLLNRSNNRSATCGSSGALRFFAPPLGTGQAVCYGPTGDGIHGVDEWVDLESIADVATVLALLLRRWGDSA